MGFRDRLIHGWNAFWGRDPTPNTGYGFTETYRTSSMVLSRGNERDTINAALNRIAVDVAQLNLEHARLDEEGRYDGPMKTQLNECLNVSANIDQSARAFVQDAVMTMLTEGVAAIVPTECTEDPRKTGSYDIGSFRVGVVTKWFPGFVRVSLYNELTGQREERNYPKNMVALPENPFYEIMNRPNSTYRRLLEKLRQLDAIDRQSASGKLDLLIQVPYATHTDMQRVRAENRRKDIETQLSGSKYGVAYIEGTEKVIQLNRAVENNLFTQIEYYTGRLFAQLGLPEAVFDGTADEAILLNYQNRTIAPIITALVDEMKRKFLTKRARTEGQTIWYISDPFKNVTLDKIAEVANAMVRNEVLTPNEVRTKIGFRPAADPKADTLHNASMPDEENGDAKSLPVQEVKEVKSK